MKDMIDVVFPCHPKDFDVLGLAVEGARNLSGCRNIYVISPESPDVSGITVVSEREYDHIITIEEIRQRWQKHEPRLAHRSSWLYQQFLKLFAVRVIGGLTDSVVIIDADTIFLKDVVFEQGKFQYSVAHEYHIPYLKPIRELLGKETVGFSTIAHHMIVDRSCVNLMFDEIEQRHGCSAPEAILRVADYSDSSCFADYDLYANYMLLNFPDRCEKRQLNWSNVPFIPSSSQLQNFANTYDFISCHAWMRK